MRRVTFVQNFVNRNPRNLERLRLQPKPTGWEFEKRPDQKNFFYRVDFIASKKNTAAYIVHYEDGVVLSATTHEKDVSSRLYSCSDSSAAHNLARLLAHRCKLAGITKCTPGLGFGDGEDSKRANRFFETLKGEGIDFQEPAEIPHTHLNDPNYTWEPFPDRHTQEDKLDELDLSLEPGKGRI